LPELLDQQTLPVAREDEGNVIPKTIEVVNDILAIAWDDGHESYFEFEALRRACPCALCKGETNVMVEYKPPPQKLTPASFQLRGWQYVGGYAIQPQWADGHASGIYSFQYLRSLEPRA
jgi:DUF971 family protein